MSGSVRPKTVADDASGVQDDSPSVRGKSVTKVVASAVLLCALVVVISACGQAPPTEPSITSIQRASPPIPQPAPTSAPGEEGGPEVLVGTPFTVNMIDNGGAGPFMFEPVDLTFNQGDVINFTFIADGAFHTFTVADLDINVEINAGEASGLDFVFEEAGTYALICIPHEAQGMVGTLVIQPASGG